MIETIGELVAYVRSHRCYNHSIFRSWAVVRPNPTTIGALFHQIQNFCASTRPGGVFPHALIAHGLADQGRLIQEIVDSEKDHGLELATMAGYIVNQAANWILCEDLYDQAAVEARLREFSDQLLAPLPGYGCDDGLAVQTREAMSVFDSRHDCTREATVRNLGTALALEMVSNNHIIPGEKYCLIDSRAYGVSMDQPEMRYLMTHYGEIGAERQHEKNAIEAVASIIDDRTAPLITEGTQTFLDSLEKLWDFLESTLLHSGYRLREVIPD